MEQFATGTTLVYFNQWTGWESDEIRGAFKQLTFDEVIALSTGDRVWLDVDPLHPNGKVYGYVLHEVKSVENTDSNTIMLRFSRGGYTTVWRDGNSGVFRLKNERDTLRFVEQNPLATRVVTEEGERIARAMGL